MTMTANQVLSLANTVDRWHVPPVCQGQMVVVSYGMAEDGIPMRKTVDRSDSDSTTYEVLEDGDREWEPWNREPGGDAVACAVIC